MADEIQSESEHVFLRHRFQKSQFLPVQTERFQTEKVSAAFLNVSVLGAET